MKFAYYPGCASKSTSIEYDHSVSETFRHLGIELEEIPDWNCCGASSGHMLNHELALALPGRTLALAEKMALDIVTPCPACSLRHQVAERELEKDQRLKARIEADIGTPLKLSQKTKHVLEILHRDVGVNSLQKKIQRSLKGLKAVTYYGCYLVRPPEITEFDDPENPTKMDELMQALDVEVIDWSYKVDCCGGGISLTNSDMVKKLVGKIVAAASEVGAEAIITSCPLCQTNLDMYQPANDNFQPLPVFFSTELTALALGSPHMKEWAKKHLVKPTALLERLNLL